MTVKSYSLCYRRYEDSPTCTNIVFAEREEDVHEYASGYAWHSVSEVDADYVKTYSKRGMPVVPLAL